MSSKESDSDQLSRIFERKENPFKKTRLSKDSPSPAVAGKSRGALAVSKAVSKSPTIASSPGKSIGSRVSSIQTPVVRTVPKSPKPVVESKVKKRRLSKAPDVIDLVDDGCDASQVTFDLTGVDIGGERMPEPCRAVWSSEKLVVSLSQGDLTLMSPFVDCVRVGAVSANPFIALKPSRLEEGGQKFPSFDATCVGQDHAAKNWVILLFSGKSGSFSEVRQWLEKDDCLWHKKISLASTTNFPLYLSYVNERLRSRVQRNTSSSGNGVVPSQADMNVVLQYPPDHRDVITLYESDLTLLLTDDFLNDSLIAFYLKFLQFSLIPVAVERKWHCKTNVHIFSTFFFVKFSKHGYDGVRKWVPEDVDIFEKDFLFFPVNEDLHWFLIVVCFPKDPKRACICSLDSLGGRYSLRTAKKVRSYLVAEWDAKKKDPCPTPFLRVKVEVLHVPQQSNFWDCGVYLLHYVERIIFTDVFEHGPVQLDQLFEWFQPREIPYKRKELALLVKSLRNSPEVPKKLLDRIEKFAREDTGEVMLMSEGEDDVEVEILNKSSISDKQEKIKQQKQNLAKKKQRTQFQLPQKKKAEDDAYDPVNSSSSSDDDDFMPRKKPIARTYSRKK